VLDLDRPWGLSDVGWVLIGLGLVELFGVSVVLVGEDLADVGGERADVPGEDLVQVLELLAVDDEALADGELVELLVFEDVDVLVAVGVDFPGDGEVVVALGAGPDDGVADFHVAR